MMMNNHALSRGVLASAAPCYNFRLNPGVRITVSLVSQWVRACACWKKAQRSHLVSEGREG